MAGTPKEQDEIGTQTAKILDEVGLREHAVSRDGERALSDGTRPVTPRPPATRTGGRQEFSPALDFTLEHLLILGSVILVLNKNPEEARKLGVKLQEDKLREIKRLGNVIIHTNRGIKDRTLAARASLGTLMIRLLTDGRVQEDLLATSRQAAEPTLKSEIYSILGGLSASNLSGLREVALGDLPFSRRPSGS